MTIVEWLAGRAPEPPLRLRTRINEVLASRRASSDSEVATCCMDAACELLGSLVERPEAGREAALDLLTVDALVTYAFEALAGDPQRLGRFARESMQRLAAVAPLPT